MRIRVWLPDDGVWYVCSPCSSLGLSYANMKFSLPMSYTRLLYHLIFRTKHSVPAIVPEYERELYGYIWGFVKNKDSILYRIGGMPEHLHLLFDLSSKYALADFVRDLKTTTAKWLRSNPHFPTFPGWGKGYAAFTYSLKEKETIINYIMRQKEHHAVVSFEAEVRRMFAENGLSDKVDFFLKDDEKDVQ